MKVFFRFEYLKKANQKLKIKRKLRFNKLINKKTSKVELTKVRAKV